MGMYTELVCAFELKKGTPIQVNETLKYMLDYSGDDIETPDHELFETSRWEFMLRSDSYYFTGTTDSSMRKDDITNAYIVNVRCNLKNYDDEIKKFIDWIKPYVRKDYMEEREFIGYTRYEEAEEPTLIYV